MFTLITNIKCLDLVLNSTHQHKRALRSISRASSFSFLARIAAWDSATSSFCFFFHSCRFFFMYCWTCKETLPFLLKNTSKIISFHDNSIMWKCWKDLTGKGNRKRNVNEEKNQGEEGCKEIKGNPHISIKHTGKLNRLLTAEVEAKSSTISYW